MRILPFIAFCLLSFLSFADHLLGTEITYTHITAQKYEVNVTLYRNCTECKLGNDGGGTQTKKCSDLDRAFIRTVSAACQDTRVGTILLTKVGSYRNITEVCDKEQSACGTSPSLPYGIEAHYYKGTVDFSEYASYTGCEFHIFINKTHRSNAINTLLIDNDWQHNFATINPWLTAHSSPTISSIPSFILPLNQPVYQSLEVESTKEDSLVFALVRPYRAHNDAIPYAVGFSSSTFISSYCPSGDCTPDQTSNPPKGISFDSYTANLVFTPTVANQQVIQVIEIEQWRTINGTPVKVGTIRRDIHQKVVTGVDNNVPHLLGSKEIAYCVGQTVDDTLYIADLPFVSTANPDSVQIYIQVDLPGISAVVIPTTTAPFRAIRLQGILTDSSIGKHLLYYHLKDNHCPAYGQSSGNLTLRVHPLPEISLSSKPLFCGNHTIEIISNTDSSTTHSLSLQNSIQSLITDSLVKTGFVLKDQTEGELYLQLLSLSSFGCIDTTSLIIDNKGSTQVDKASVKKDTPFLCDGDSISLSLEHPLLSIQNTHWSTSTENTKIRIDTFKTSEPTIYLDYLLVQNSLTCNIHDTLILPTLQKTTVNFQEPMALCYTDSIPLSDYVVAPAGGLWEVNDIVISDFLPLYEIVPNANTQLDITYVYTAANGCITKITKTQPIKMAPILELQNQSVCGVKSNFRLKNSISLPFSPRVDDLTWTILDADPSLILRTGTYKELDIKNAGMGTYTIAASNTLINGCVARDTFTISVTDDIKLLADTARVLCQGNEEVNLSETYAVNVSGGGWSSNFSLNHTTLSNFIPKECGPIDLSYVYDRNGCYEELKFTSQIICRPSFKLAADSFCVNSDPVELPNTYSWSGIHITNDTFSPSGLTPDVYTHTAYLSTNGCTFDTTTLATVLPALDFSWAPLQRQLCEGELLSILFQKPSYGILTLENCTGIRTEVLSTNHTYTPVACDLTNESIKQSVTLSAPLNCPEVSKDILIPYFKKPTPITLAPIKGCEPLDIDIFLDTKSEISFMLTGSDQQIEGNTTTIKASNLMAGDYNLTMIQKNTYGCETTTILPAAIEVYATPEANFSMYNEKLVTLAEREVYLNNISTLPESTDKLDYLWTYTYAGEESIFSTLENPIFELPRDTGIFQLKLLASTTRGCSDSMTTTMRVVPDIIAFIPSAFTPDNKGPKSNAQFRVISAHAAEFSIEVYNKWGQRVFSSTNINEAWDGTYLGSYCQNGVYLYNVKIVNKVGEKYTYHGTVNLIR